ncbi:hypothetical protein JJQ59_15160 [Cupriavidus necator]|uniref:Uncharacterized protein n=1 Tax=Cupriavidus necator TaxID=106590 RepID=A0A367PHP8_CUPNE|nr:hypothetical protein JJQ59_15160 [Cupriavidus necator]RCJ07392.1 hypothetical protein DDK22_16610 [Cupriavidus necator]
MDEKHRARVAARSRLRAAATGYAYAEPLFGNLDIATYAGELDQQAAKIAAGDMTGVESMLIHQANTLDMMFNRLAYKATHSEYLNEMEAHLRHALRAQAQCRATLETLAEIKNPRPVAFVKQANIAAGPQQVNNSVPPSRARENAGNQPNELLEVKDGERLDSGTTRAAGRGDPPLETVAEVYRPRHAKG